jgi:hypothetical protein
MCKPFTDNKNKNCRDDFDGIDADPTNNDIRVFIQVRFNVHYIALPILPASEKDIPLINPHVI